METLEPPKLIENKFSSTSHGAGRLRKLLAAGGEPSTRFPPGGIVETAGIPDYSELPRPP